MWSNRGPYSYRRDGIAISRRDVRLIRFGLDDPSVTSTAAATAISPTAAVSSATTTGAATATSTTAAIPASTPAGARLTWFGLVDCQTSPLKFLIIQGVDGSLRRRGRTHFNEAEATASTCLSVFNDLSGLNLAEFGKELFEVGSAGLERKVADVKLRAQSHAPVKGELDPPERFPGPVKGADRSTRGVAGSRVRRARADRSDRHRGLIRIPTVSNCIGVMGERQRISGCFFKASRLPCVSESASIYRVFKDR